MTPEGLNYLKFIFIFLNEFHIENNQKKLINLYCGGKTFTRNGRYLKKSARYAWLSARLPWIKGLKNTGLNTSN